MNHASQHIILIGFKYVGKSVIGKALAEKLQKPFIDLDRTIETLYVAQKNSPKTCRQILQLKGEPFFRQLEHQALNQIIHHSSSVISVGGGAPLKLESQALLAPHLMIYVTAPKGIVFERIMIHGRPAFFTPDENPFDTFMRLWSERGPVYQKLATFSVENRGTVEEAITSIMKHHEIAGIG